MRIQRSWVFNTGLILLLSSIVWMIASSSDVQMSGTPWGGGSWDISIPGMLPLPLVAAGLLLMVVSVFFSKSPN